MKVWECTICSVLNSNNNEPCILFDTTGELKPNRCPNNIGEAHWHKTNRYKITERKPDYKAMAENKQFGKFFDTCPNSVIRYDYLIDYNFQNGFPFTASKQGSFECFIPYTEPKELDPVTLEEKKKC